MDKVDIAALIALITLGASLVVYIVQQQIQHAQFFNQCAKSLYSSNPMEQNTAAILLRSFLKCKRFNILERNFKKETKNLMVVLLRSPISATLQKTLADGFSYADDLRGQDMQHVNLLGALIKPQSRINYELTLKDRYKKSRLSMKKADFFYAILQECSINNVDATGAVFYCAIMSGTNFKNCILKEADFRSCNIRRVVFDEDCILEEAKFDGAIGINEAVVKVKEIVDNKSVTNKYYLDAFLDAKGVFHHDRSFGNLYKSHSENINIFISKLGAMDSQQTLHYEAIKNIVDEYDRFNVCTIERHQYRPVSQLIDIETKLNDCDGCVIFAFDYLEVNSGAIHKNVVGDDRQIIKDKHFASPWLHIETALANAKQKPCLIIFDQDLQRNGMFDELIARSDKNIVCLPFTDTISKDSSELMRWVQLVHEYHQRKQN
jgi:uncharacterized protein YjbI with pentapeptide repeats